MKVSKTKYVVEFTEEEQKAILTVCNIADSLYCDNLCTDLKCENCPLNGNFCMFGNSDERIKNIKQKLEKFINEE